MASTLAACNGTAHGADRNHAQAKKYANNRFMRIILRKTRCIDSAKFQRVPNFGSPRERKSGSTSFRRSVPRNDSAGRKISHSVSEDGSKGGPIAFGCRKNFRIVFSFLPPGLTTVLIDSKIGQCRLHGNPGCCLQGGSDRSQGQAFRSRDSSIAFTAKSTAANRFLPHYNPASNTFFVKIVGLMRRADTAFPQARVEKRGAIEREIHLERDRKIFFVDHRGIRTKTAWSEDGFRSASNAAVIRVLERACFRCGKKVGWVKPKRATHRFGREERWWSAFRLTHPTR